jgi:hypothetical protein
MGLLGDSLLLGTTQRVRGETQMKTCNTCKWFIKIECGEACRHAPPVALVIGDVVKSAWPDTSFLGVCSKWETKKERECRNCEFFAVSGGEAECRREPPDFDGDFPATDYGQWCGEFKGRE